jgi:hypothetical protein
MAIQGIPVILAGLAHYGGNGFTNDVLSKAEYHALLDSPPKKLDKHTQNMAEHFSYFYFIASNTPRTYVSHENKTLISFNVKKFEELLEREDIQRICKYITEDVLFQET